MIVESGDRRDQVRSRLGSETRYQDGTARRAHPFGDRDHLLRGLPLAEDRLRESVAERAVLTPRLLGSTAIAHPGPGGPPRSSWSSAPAKKVQAAMS